MDTVARYLAGYDAAIMFLRYHAKEKHGFILSYSFNAFFRSVGDPVCMNL